MISTGTDSRAQRWLCRAREWAIHAFAVFAPFSIALLQAAQVLTNLSWLASARRTRDGGPVRWPLAVPLLLFLGLSLVSALLGVDPATSLRGLKSEWLPLVFLWACLNSLSLARAQRVVTVLLTAGAAAAIVGLSQTWSRGLAHRIDGTFGHYMTFSGVLLLLSLLAAAQLVFNRRVHKLWIVGVLGLLLAALALTQTRSAWLGLLAGSVPLLWSIRKRAVLALPILAVVGVLLAPQPVKQRIYSVIDLEDITLNERFYMWQAGWNIFREYPLTGAGPDALGRVYAQYKHPDDPRLRFTHLHSNFVQTGAERGALALIAWLSIWVVFFLHAARIYRRVGSAGDDPGRALVIGSVCAIVGFLVAGLFECNYRDSEVSSLAFFVMALPFCADRPQDG